VTDVYSTADARITVPDVDDFISIAAGETHTCGLLRTGAISCWYVMNTGALPLMFIDFC
jgi:hypothetical protein